MPLHPSPLGKRNGIRREKWGLPPPGGKQVSLSLTLSDSWREEGGGPLCYPELRVPGVAFVFSIDYFLEEFEVHSKAEQEVQRVPIYPWSPVYPRLTHAQPPHHPRSPPVWSTCYNP